MVSLILQKNYRDITIKDILDEANVGRSTFYAHYTGKDDLLASGFAHLRTELIAFQEQSLARRGGIEARGLGFSLAMFEHAGDHVDVYKALIGEHGGTVAQNHIRQIIAELVRKDLSAILEHDRAGEMPRELVAQHIVGSFMATLVWWLDGGAKLRPERVDEVFRQLIMHGVKDKNE